MKPFQGTLKLHLAKLIQKLSQLSFVKSIILFGSRARQDGSDRSDIDLAIVCQENTSNQEWQKVMDIIEDAETLLTIDCLRYDTLDKDNALRQAIDKDGMTLYQAPDIETDKS
jgi:predicted nucleotidyltransferase